MTASKFGAVLRSGLSSTPCASLMKRVLGGYNLDGVMAVNWGVVNEAEGVKAFVQAYQETVFESGLFVSESVFWEHPPMDLCSHLPCWR